MFCPKANIPQKLLDYAVNERRLLLLRTYCSLFRQYTIPEKFTSSRLVSTIFPQSVNGQKHHRDRKIDGSEHAQIANMV